MDILAKLKCTYIFWVSLCSSNLRFMQTFSIFYSCTVLLDSKLILLIKVSRQNQKLLKRIKQTVETISRIIKFTGTIRTKRRLLLWLELDFSCQISSKDGYCIPGYGVSVRVHQKAGIGLPLLFALFEIGNGHGITQAATACKVMNLARNCRIET